jgi:hypothetical protein
LQYLWITAYYSKRSDAGEPAGRFLLESFLVGTCVSVVPALLFAPDRFGRLPWDAGLAMVTFSAVNVHHFILDGAIWKLRDGAIARLLLWPSPPGAGAPTAAELGNTALRIGRVVARRAGTADQCLRGLRDRSSPTPERIDLAVQRSCAGWDESRFDSISRWGGRNEQESRGEAAIAHYRRSSSCSRTAEAWSALGRLYADAVEARGTLWRPITKPRC